MKRIVVYVVVLSALLLAACGSTAPKAPDACNAELGCAVIAKGQTIKIGMGAPMTGDNAAFGALQHCLTKVPEVLHRGLPKEGALFNAISGGTPPEQPAPRRA